MSQRLKAVSLCDLGEGKISNSSDYVEKSSCWNSLLKPVGFPAKIETHLALVHQLRLKIMPPGLAVLITIFHNFAPSCLIKLSNVNAIIIKS